MATLLVYLSVTEYKPGPEVKLPLSTKGIAVPGYVRTVNLLSWNIGYGGLGKEMDFFYDGGKRVRSSFPDYQRYLNGIVGTLSRMDTVDFFLLQEVDQAARRSYNTDQAGILSAAYPEFNASFALNYDVNFIPFPFQDPMAGVHAGLMTLSRFRPAEAVRLASPLNFSWPKRLFFMDRCLLLNRYAIHGDTSLVVINIHNSAWAEGAELRKAEIALLRKVILEEYKKGNYVIVGGDWNLNPPGFNPTAYLGGDKVWIMPPPIGKDFMPAGWQWACDTQTPTNRDVSAAYHKGKTLSTVIDFFLLSPNIRLLSVKNLNLGFENSDHNPVYLNVRLGLDTLAPIANPVF
jgi:endonuclease/exonuclease/phosphatase family metal-dependent hydrolase